MLHVWGWQLFLNLQRLAIDNRPRLLCMFVFLLPCVVHFLSLWRIKNIIIIVASCCGDWSQLSRDIHITVQSCHFSEIFISTWKAANRNRWLGAFLRFGRENLRNIKKQIFTFSQTLQDVAVCMANNSLKPPGKTTAEFNMQQKVSFCFQNHIVQLSRMRSTLLRNSTVYTGQLTCSNYPTS